MTLDQQGRSLIRQNDASIDHILHAFRPVGGTPVRIGRRGLTVEINPTYLHLEAGVRGVRASMAIKVKVIWTSSHIRHRHRDRAEVLRVTARTIHYVRMIERGVTATILHSQSHAGSHSVGTP